MTGREVKQARPSDHRTDQKGESKMNWTIPGTTLSARREDAAKMREQFQSLFLAGGIALSQVTSITGLDPYMIQNWVKRGFLTKPTQKRYTLNQLCRIITINMLKGVLPMERI